MATRVAEPTVAVQRPESAPQAPPHIEEITSTAAPAPVAVEGNSEGPAIVPSLRASSSLGRDSAAAGATDGWNPQPPDEQADDHPRSSAAAAKRSIDESPGASWDESRMTFVPFTESEPGASHSRKQPAEERPLQPTPQESIDIPSESIVMVERPFAAQDSPAPGRAPRSGAQGSDQPPATSVTEAADRVRDEHLTRKTIVHSYLREVRAWVAATPEVDEREVEWQRDAERPSAGSDLFALEPRVEPDAPRANRPQALEVQDLNLSIGTISIVIEEPQQAVPAALPAPPGVNRSPEQPGSQPTRLSRYYLRPW